MGNRESSPLVEEPVSHQDHYKELFAELTAPDHSGKPADQKIFRNRFENYFGGPYLELGHLLYTKFFSGSELVDESSFVSALNNLESLTWQRGGFHEAELFYFTVFSNGEDTINNEVLTKILHVAATFGMVVGSELHEKAVLPKDHFIISSIIASAMLHADKTSGLLHKSQFSHWVSKHCPRLLEGIRQWTKSLLLPQTELAASKSPPYQLPNPELNGEHLLEREVELCTMIWTLSTVLPTVFMGQSIKKPDKMSCYPVGGTWTLLYSSEQHGFSMNRFQHHCSDYKEPSVLVLTCRHIQEEEVYMFAVGCDTEWRDGTYYYGGDHFCVVQLQPSFALIQSGAKLLSLNEKQRGFPTGLRVMSSTKYDDVVLEVDSSLSSAKFRGGDDMSVRRVEVWGCGGMEAMDSQRRVKDWEQREILRRRKVKTSDLQETWESSPDRYLLELGGVTTKRPTEQQQQ